MKEYDPTPLFKIPYDTDEIKLSRIFESPSLSSFATENISCDKSESVYGPLKFPELPKDRPYLYASMVHSLDGKIAFEDAPEGPLIAQLNKMDPHGGSADFWLLNLLRTVSDGTMGFQAVDGKKETETEKMFGGDLEGTAHIFDQDLEDARISGGLNPIPWQIITSLDGSDIGFRNPALNNHPFLPLMITTSPAGLDHVKSKCRGDYFIVDDPDRVPGPDSIKGIPVIITGSGSMPDARITMKILKKMGLNKVLIEGPSYCHHLIQLGLLDEMFLNYSCLYVGGKALSLGMRNESFTSVNHPHTEMLSIHSHSPHFFYMRHKMIYSGT